MRWIPVLFLAVACDARMAEELDASLARETELQALADEASSALGAAIEEVRRLGAQEPFKGNRLTGGRIRNRAALRQFEIGIGPGHRRRYFIGWLSGLTLSQSPGC